ncbi:MAG: translocation/assembly module TamB, partial [Thermaceae bacterium]|nr:translocation/assembly module TamB [Thermaceae bacterium]
PWLKVNLQGQGPTLYATTSGYAELAGTVWPNTSLTGSLTLPFKGALEVPPLRLQMSREGIILPHGQVKFRAGFPFQVTLPLRVNGQASQLEASGTLTGGQLRASTPYATLEGSGDWSNLRVSGNLAAAGFSGQLSGRADLFKAAYTLNLEVPKLEGSLRVQGKSTDLTYAGQFQQGRLLVSGQYRLVSGQPLEGLRLRAIATGFDTSGLGLPARVSGSWSGRGGRLQANSAYGQLTATGTGLLGPLGIELQSPYGTLRGSASRETLEVQGDLKLPYISGSVALRGPWNRLEASGQGRYQLPYLQQRPWRFSADVLAQTWRLDGPLVLEGQGLAYQGQLAWPYTFQGRTGELSGSLEGQALSGTAQVHTVYGGVAVSAEVTAQGADLDKLTGQIDLPEGQIQIANKVATFDLETSPLAQLFNADLSGRLKGSLKLDGSGQASGTLQAYGHKLELGYQGRTLSAFLPQQNLGVRLVLEQTLQLSGLGDLSGSLRINDQVSGHLAYQQGATRVQADLSGSPQQPAFQLAAQGPWGQATGTGLYNLAQNRGQASLEANTPYARGALELSGSASGYQAAGRLESLQYLKQAGPLRLSGEGGRWSLVWAAPLGLEAQGNGASLASVGLNGRGSLEIGGQTFNLSGNIRNVGQDFSGQMAVAGQQVSLLLKGEKGNLQAAGEVYGAALAAQTNRQGDLTGTLSYTRDLGSNRLAAKATLAGSLLKPLVQGQGFLQGKGAQIALSFAYDGALRASAAGPGLQATYQQGWLKLDADTSLEPFTGLPIRLKSKGEGQLASLELPLDLSGPNLRASGLVNPAKLSARLAGTYQTQKFDLSYNQGLEARFSGPYAVGVVRYQNQPSGSLTLELPVPGGRLVGAAYLDTGRVSLEGQGGWKGVLEANLRQGWSQPTRWQVRSDLSGLLSIKSQFDLDAAPLGVQGNAQLELPGWGQLSLVGKGAQVAVSGRTGLEPLVGKLQLSPLKFDWSYAGNLPKGLGSLAAKGSYPGTWISGQYQALGQRLTLEGQGPRLDLSGQGLQAHLTPQGLEAKLQNFALSSASLSGEVGGSWSHLQSNLGWKAWGRAGEVRASWQQNHLEASLKGDLAGAVSYDQSWKGSLRFREGQATLSGTGIPTLEGQVLGLGVRLAYPVLEISSSQPVQTHFSTSVIPQPRSTAAVRVLRGPLTVQGQTGHLSFNIAEHSASGELSLNSLALRGQGPTLEAAYPLDGGRLLGSLDLDTYALTLTAPGLGQGSLSYSGGKLGGSLEASLYGLGLSLKGQDDHILLQGTHPDTGWLPWKGGSLSAKVGLNGLWQATYQAQEGNQSLQAQGKLLEASLKAKGRWLNGDLQYAANGSWAGTLKTDLPLPALDSRAILQMHGQGELDIQGKLEGGVGSLNLAATLGRGGPKASAQFSDLNLAEVPLLSARIPFLEGRASGQVDYSGGAAKFSLSSPALSVKNDNLALSSRMVGSLERGVLQASLDFDRTQTGGLVNGQNNVPDTLGSSHSHIALRMDAKTLSAQATASAFPLHWLLSAWTGGLAGQAYWTGKATFTYNFQNPWASKGILVGQNLRFMGGGDALTGQAVLRFEGERFYIDQLALSGKGTWKGSGYWGRTQSNLHLDLENTTFTPVLQVIPALKPYAPEGSGTLRLSSDGKVFDLSVENFRFKLGPVRAETPRARLQVSQTVVAEGHIKLTAPYPAEADLSGEGNADGLTVSAKGTADLPFVSPNEPFTLSFSYPSYVLDARLVNQQARLNGTLFPHLALALQGPVPVSYPQYFLLDGLVNTNLVLNYDQGEYRVLGSVEVMRARLGLPQGQKEVAIPVTGSSPAASQGSPIPLQFINVQIKADRGILIQEPLAQGELGGELYLNGDASSPYLSGEVVPVRGNFKLWNRDFTIRDRSSTERSYARFSPDAGILPKLQIVADTQVQDQATNQNVKVNLTLKGQFVRQNGKIKVNLDPVFSAQASSVSLTQAEIYSLLLLGRSDLSVLPTDVAQSGLQGVVQNFLVGQLETELSKALGLDQVKVDIPLLGGGKAEETKFTIGKYLSPELFFAYSVDLRGYQTIYAEYQQGDYRFTFSSDITPTPRPTFSFGYTIRPIGADLTIDIATPSVSDSQTTGFSFGVGLTFRF